MAEVPYENKELLKFIGELRHFFLKRSYVQALEFIAEYWGDLLILV